MGNVIRRSGYSAILSYLGFFIGYVNMLWLFPYAFSPEEIGLLRLILAVSTLFATLFTFGGSQVATRYFPYFADTIQRRSAFFKFICGIAVAGSVLFLLIFILFHSNIIDIYSKKSPLFVNYLWYLIPITVSLILYGILEAFVIVQKYPIVPTLLKEIYIRALLTVASLAFLVSLISFSGFIKLICILYCITPVIIILYANTKRLVPWSGTIKNIHKKEFKEIAEFGTFIFLGNAGASLLANIDSIVISAYSGLVSTGIYGIALYIAVIIEIPKRSLSQVLIPMVVQANKDYDINTLNTLHKKSSINQFVIGSFIFLVIWLNIDNIFSLIPNGDIYREGIWVVFLIGLAKLFDMLSGINAEIVGTSKYYKIDLLFYSIVSAVGISLNFFLIPVYGIFGAALALLLSAVLLNITRFIFIKVKMNIQPFTYKTLAAILCAIITYIILLFIPHFHNIFIDIVMRTVTITLVFWGLILSLKISEDISLTFGKILTRLNLHR
ncbi:MAG: oligosaccharide flippase family protein [Bacteroidetes bacterium]|nr:oligosaccharide flippase family protein [Bacteroidota bacterium]